MYFSCNGLCALIGRKRKQNNSIIIIIINIIRMCPQNVIFNATCWCCCDPELSQHWYKSVHWSNPPTRFELEEHTEKLPFAIVPFRCPCDLNIGQGHNQTLVRKCHAQWGWSSCKVERSQPQSLWKANGQPDEHSSLTLLMWFRMAHRWEHKPSSWNKKRTNIWQNNVHSMSNKQLMAATFCSVHKYMKRKAKKQKYTCILPSAILRINPALKYFSSTAVRSYYQMLTSTYTQCKINLIGTAWIIKTNTMEIKW